MAKRKKMSEWQHKYKGELRNVQKRVQIAKTRGYLVPQEILDVAYKNQAKGGYRQAYEKLHRYSQLYIQRHSAYIHPTEGIVRGGTAMRLQREEKLAEKKRKAKHIRELQQLYEDTYEAITGNRPSKVPEIADSTTESDISDMLSKVAFPEETVKEPEAITVDDMIDDNIYKVQDLIKTVVDRDLQYNLQKAFNEAMKDNMEVLKQQLSESINNETGEWNQDSVLQRIEQQAEIKYVSAVTEEDEETGERKPTRTRKGQLLNKFQKFVKGEKPKKPSASPKKPSKPKVQAKPEPKPEPVQAPSPNQEQKKKLSREAFMKAFMKGK